MTYLIVPDSFKGTMSSSEVCSILEKGVRTHHPDAEIICIPVADGGEGTVDAFLQAVGGEKVYLTVKGPNMNDMRGFYGLLDGGGTAVIEMAACAGLPLAGDDKHVEKRTTYGVGQLMSDALARGVQRIIVGLGGSATNDMGAGAAAALGVRFLDGSGQPFIPVGETLSNISRIETGGMLERLSGIDIVAMCDIDNPLVGEHGAAAVFGPQKGASPQTVCFLDGQLRAAADVCRVQLGVDVTQMPGAGAAGGMGGGMVAFLGARLRMGIDAVLDAVSFDALLDQADLVLTGEGKLDRQSLRGKAVIGVARRAKKKNVPTIAIVGDIGDGIAEAYSEGVTGVFSINRVAVPFGEAKRRCRGDLALTIDNLMRFMNGIHESKAL